MTYLEGKCSCTHVETVPGGRLIDEHLPTSQCLFIVDLMSV